MVKLKSLVAFDVWCFHLCFKNHVKLCSSVKIILQNKILKAAVCKNFCLHRLKNDLQNVKK